MGGEPPPGKNLLIPPYLTWKNPVPSHQIFIPLFPPPPKVEINKNFQVIPQ